MLTGTVVAYTFIYQGVWETSSKLKKEVREHLRNREGFESGVGDRIIEFNSGQTDLRNN